MNFQRICYKNCRVPFCLVLQFTANLLGSRKKSKYSFPQAPGFCADGIFILFMYFDADNIHLTEKISLHRTYWLVFIGGDIDYFLPSIISVSKYTAKNKYHRRKNQGPIGMNHCAFSAAQNICSKLQNPAKWDPAAFTTNPLKLNFSYTFLIATSGYNS